jgi:bacteriocin-like protein
MDNKNLQFQTPETVNCLTRQDLPTEMAELSDKDLQQIVGGRQLEDAGASSCAVCSSPCSNSLSFI